MHFSRVFLALTLLALTACGTGFFLVRDETQVRKKFTPAAGYHGFPPVAEAGVAIYYLDAPQDLPPGVLPPQDENPQRELVDWVELEPDFPTSKEPHQKVGYLSVSPDGLPIHRDAPSILAEEAGRLGANAIVLMGSRPGFHGVALRLSGAAPAPQRSAAELLAKTPDRFQGFTRDGAPTVASLEAFAPLIIQGKRGTCYAVHAALDSQSSLDGPTRRLLGLVETSAGGVGSMPFGEAQHFRQGRVGERELTRVIGCPTEDHALVVSFFGAQHEGPAPHGQGPMSFQIYTRPVELPELDRASAEIKVKIRDLQRQADHAADVLRRDCDQCARELRHCPGVSEENCEAYSMCLRMKATRVSDCAR